ncbi:MAG: glycoside hydrolase family 71/99-like protein [Bacteroidales bacterium]|nr:glycoside hydrolase family 71/99-like protein [Bacteroidales bacterium]
MQSHLNFKKTIGTAAWLLGRAAVLAFAPLLSMAGEASLSPQAESRQYDTYQGLIMAGYQGWFNTPGDGAERGWHHYDGNDGFRPGSCTIDFWPDVTEYDKTYPSPFTLPSGENARLFSSYDPETVETHFRWMEEAGVDGVFMQRFITEIRTPKGLRHFNRVLASAMEAANRHSRAIAVMYDLSGMRPGEEQLLLSDLDTVAQRHGLWDRDGNPSYLYHRGRPLVAVWGIGFDDGRGYGYAEAQAIIGGLRERGYSIMIGVPTGWRQLSSDALPDPELHRLIEQCDVVMPWFVGRYGPEEYESFLPLIEGDMRWAEEHGVDYAPLCFPGFSWRNMPGHGDSRQIPRLGGDFLWQQLSACIGLGAKMVYVAMFDEIDEGTAVMPVAREVPVGESRFVPLDEGLSPDHYLWLIGQASLMLRGILPLTPHQPQRAHDYRCEQISCGKIFLQLAQLFYPFKVANCDPERIKQHSLSPTF